MLLNFLRSILKYILPRTNKQHAQKHTLSVPKGPYDFKVVFEDKDLAVEVSKIKTNDIIIPKSIVDVN